MPEEHGTKVVGEVAPKTMPTATLVELLERSKHRFAPQDRVAKRSAVLALADRPIRSGVLLLRFHEALCFMQAYPSDAKLLRVVEGILADFGKRVAALGTTEVRRLEETGVARTTVYCPLSYAAARWLTRRFPESAELDWDDPENEEGLAAILPLLVDVLAEEALVEVGVPYRRWLAVAKGEDPRSDVAWILDRLERRPRGREAARALYDRVQPRIQWELRESVAASRTLAKVPGRPVFFHRGALLPRGGPLGRRLPGPRAAVRAASMREAGELLDTAFVAVTLRYREVHGFNFADPGDVVVADVGRGVEVAWLGVLPAHRLPVRAHYGYLLLKNGVPVGYGDASLLFDWCEIAFNIFDTFRQGESAFIFVRLLAFLYQWLHVRAFYLSPYQLGYENEEAIASGAFWFYYKLGFRPTRPDLVRLADDEQRRIARDRTHRSSRETLQRFCEGSMFASLDSPSEAAVRDFEVRRVALRVAADGRMQPAAHVVAEVARSLGVPRWRAWLRSERVAFERLAPILALIPDLARWPLRERRALADIVRAKGGLREAEYLRRMQAHSRLRESLLKLGALH